MKRTVKKFLKSVKYDVTFKSAEDFLKTLGYCVVFFGTRAGDAEIAKHRLEYMAESESAFTYCGQCKIVFIKSSLHLNDKLLLLLHEIGHILFGHLEKNKHLTRDDVKAEMEADTFAYSVLNYKKPLKLPIVISAALIAVLLLTPLAFYSRTQQAVKVGAENNINKTADVPDTSLDNTVYVTATGHKYHRANCFFLKNGSIPISREEAEKNYTPCLICNP